MEDRNLQIVNELLVELFNSILIIEQHDLRATAASPLSISEIHVLEAIEKEPDPIMSKVANKLLITVGTLTTAIKKIVEKGYVYREVDSNDRRRIYLRLTKKGEEVCRIHDQFHREMLQEIKEESDFLEDDVLIESLERVSNFFRKKRAKVSAKLKK